jgi:molybdopterin-guanine dinucleotide biosynthesis protein A
MAMTTVGGIILCGGESSRMGQPKAWLPFGDELMIHRVVRVVKEVVGPVIVVAAPDQKLPNLPTDVSIVRDEFEGRGPLQGLASGLEDLPKRVDCVYLSSCDVPFLRATFVRRVISFIKEHEQIAVPRVGDRFHPLAAAYRTAVLPSVLRLLAAGKSRLTDLFVELPTRVIEQHELTDVDPDFESLRNLNTWAEYEAALQVLRKRQ